MTAEQPSFKGDNDEKPTVTGLTEKDVKRIIFLEMKEHFDLSVDVTERHSIDGAILEVTLLYDGEVLAEQKVWI